ncbi:MAG TPA: HAD hydrolase family protein [Woeseiaceae bacterium]|nr:HAD hydrolase family protein [Woeseiaceae bacterium]
MSTAAADNRSRAVRLAVFDVDGVFTDGRIWISDDGVESKAFCVQDGYGIKALLGAGVAVAVISGRTSEAVRIRMAELGVPHVFQRVTDKVATFDRLAAELEVEPEQCVYTGDDVPDLPLLRRVGFAVAVANAVDEVKAACDYVTRAPGGSGAVREVCELILRGGAVRPNARA